MTVTLLDHLTTRRSLKPDKLGLPGPSVDQLQQILTIAARVPDHKKLAPWRFVIFEGQARAQFGEIFAQASLKEDREPPSAIRLEFERKRLMRAPCVVAVISRIVQNPGAPEWEQVLSAGACCYNMCLAANALGFGSCWITEWVSYSPTVRAGLNLADNERIAGFVYMGTRGEIPTDRDRPDLASITTRWPST
jgi:nitroreductase